MKMFVSSAISHFKRMFILIILYIEFLGKISENKIEICETNAFGGMQLFFNKIKM